MKQTIVTPFDTELIAKIDRNVIIVIDDISLLGDVYDFAQKTDRVEALVCDTPETDIVDIFPVMPMFQIPVYVSCTFGGNKFELIKAVTHNKRIENVTYLLRESAQDRVVALKMLSSMGCNCGLAREEGTVSSDDLLELATYHFLCPAMHAAIEPFGYMESETKKQARYADIGSYYFNNPDKFLFIDRSEGIALNLKDLKEQKYIATSLQELEAMDLSEAQFAHKEQTFYSHFANHSKCMACPAMKICSGFYSDQTSDCTETMTEIYDMIN